MEDHEPKDCKFFLKEKNSTNSVEEVVNGEKVKKIKRVRPVLDENGNQIFEIKEVKVRQGCRCKGKKEKIIKKKVPVTEEYWIEKKIPENTKIVKKKKNTDIFVCKLYGALKKDFCKTCSTFKRRK